MQQEFCLSTVHQEELMEVCESENFDDGLQNLQDKLRKQQE